MDNVPQNLSFKMVLYAFNTYQHDILILPTKSTDDGYDLFLYIKVISEDISFYFTRK